MRCYTYKRGLRVFNRVKLPFPTLTLFGDYVQPRGKLFLRKAFLPAQSFQIFRQHVFYLLAA